MHHNFLTVTDLHALVIFFFNFPFFIHKDNLKLGKIISYNFLTANTFSKNINYLYKVSRETNFSDRGHPNEFYFILFFIFTARVCCSQIGRFCTDELIKMRDRLFSDEITSHVPINCVRGLINLKDFWWRIGNSWLDGTETKKRFHVTILRYSNARMYI